ncbi:hypothetical protein CPLU01_14916 [Colletotrichum plurivorum]|uniref:Uncharacterized protein n=1 Tax=Colletotrichum plurivorum TaxID=2175906 RepID=A0A8H6JFN4_9PEZI|nr:hypothetical protein CPLU01_14916 [Colletotrichum plurivorum]
MKTTALWLLVANVLFSGVSATCLNSGPGSSTFDGVGGCKQGNGFDHKCPDGTAFFACCSNSNCT